EKLVMQFGPNITVNQGSPLWLYQKPVLGFHPCENPNLGNRVIIFDSYIEDRSGGAWMEIEDGYFKLEVGSTDDLEFVPSLSRLNAHHRDGTSLMVRYRRVPKSKFDEWWKAFDWN